MRVKELKTMRFIGIDLHYDNFIAAYLRDDEIVKTVKIYLNDVKTFQQFLNDLTENDYVAVEASTNSFWFYERVYQKVKGCFVINTSRFSIISSTNKKTDKIDAKKIAKKLRYKIFHKADEDEFPTVYVPKKQVQELRTLFTTYELLQKQMVSIKNRIFSLLVGRGYYFKSKELYNMMRKKNIFDLPIPDSVKFQLKLLYEEIEFQENKLRECKNMILKTGTYFKREIEKLIEIKGISVFVAIAIMTDIADIKRFKSSKKLCSYLRSAPKIDSSNKSEKIGCINKQSRKLALNMLLQGIYHSYKSSPYLYSFFQRKTKGKKTGKVRIAVARKIFAGIFHMLKKDTHYYWIDTETYNKKKSDYDRFINNMKKSA
jgi:transposase